jgi:hypothetical protein
VGFSVLEASVEEEEKQQKGKERLLQYPARRGFLYGGTDSSNVPLP